MDRYKISFPENEIISRENFSVTEILPLAIIIHNENTYAILFQATQDCTEETIFIQTIIGINDISESKFFKNNSIYIENIKNDHNKFEFYKEAVKGLTPDKIYKTDFNMIPNESNKHFYTSTAARIVDNNVEVLDLLISKTMFIKISLFFVGLYGLDTTSHMVFMNPKLNNIDFVTIDHVKHDASFSDIDSDYVVSHYTVGRGPTEFRFNYISKKITLAKLRNPMNMDQYNVFFGNSFIVNDILYDGNEDKIIVLYDEKSIVTGKFKCTKALVFTKEFYDRTNLKDYSKIYLLEETK